MPLKNMSFNIHVWFVRFKKCYEKNLLEEIFAVSVFVVVIYLFPQINVQCMIGK